MESVLAMSHSDSLGNTIENIHVTLCAWCTHPWSYPAKLITLSPNRHVDEQEIYKK